MTTTTATTKLEKINEAIETKFCKDVAGIISNYKEDLEENCISEITVTIVTGKWIKKKYCTPLFTDKKMVAKIEGEGMFNADQLVSVSRFWACSDRKRNFYLEVSSDTPDKNGMITYTSIPLSSVTEAAYLTELFFHTMFYKIQKFITHSTNKELLKLADIHGIKDKKNKKENNTKYSLINNNE